MKKWILKPPSSEEALHLLMAWRIWIIGALAGALVGAALYLVFPPPFRACATVVVDQNVEEVIPEEQSDLRKYTYLQRETDKLVEVAWFDTTLGSVSDQTGIPVVDLRDGLLILSQPSDGGWHFCADTADSEKAGALAAAWATAFTDQVQSGATGVNPLAEIAATQVSDLPVNRSIPMGLSIFSGSLIGVSLFAFGLLFFHKKGEQ